MGVIIMITITIMIHMIIQTCTKSISKVREKLNLTYFIFAACWGLAFVDIMLDI